MMLYYFTTYFTTTQVRFAVDVRTTCRMLSTGIETRCVFPPWKQSEPPMP